LPVKYIPNDNELLETGDLEIIGEDPSSGTLKTGTVPVRILTGFSVFEVETRHLVAFHSLLAPRDSQHLSSYCVSGYVFPAMENIVDDNEEVLDPDSDDCQYLRLSTIRSTSLFDFDEDSRALDRYCLLYIKGLVLT
jgi:DNA (cytosine-5)-methyltransferase 1